MPRYNTIDDFHKKYIQQPNSCWEWSGGIGKDGYGTFYAYNQFWRAHRFSAKFIKGLTIDNLVVCHRCDNPLCVNPDHLFVGTQQDNMNDMKNKGRKNGRPGKLLKTPIGIFESLTKASLAHNINISSMHFRIKKHSSEYYYI
jgi:hypothetical protein